MKSKTKHILPIATDVLGRFLIGEGHDVDMVTPNLTDADRRAAQLIAAPPITGIISSVVDEIDRKSREHRDARIAIVSYYESVAPEKCTSPTDAADEIIAGIENQVSRNAFLLGFAVALRLQAAVAAGAR
jgi:hypothetical protein